MTSLNMMKEEGIKKKQFRALYQHFPRWNKFKDFAIQNFFLLYIANYNLLNIDRVISNLEVREGRDAGTIHRWFTGALLLG